MQKGTEKIELIAGFTIDFALQTIDVLADKRVTLKESLGYISVAMQLPEIIKSISEFKLEIADLDSKEVDLILIKVGEKLGEHDKDVVNEIFAAFVAWYKATETIINTIKKYSKKSNK